MPENTVSTPEHAAAVTRMTLGIASARGESAPLSLAPSCAFAPACCSFCAANEE
jgi:hypothetical protein